MPPKLRDDTMPPDGQGPAPEGVATLPTVNAPSALAMVSIPASQRSLDAVASLAYFSPGQHEITLDNLCNYMEELAHRIAQGEAALLDAKGLATRARMLPTSVTVTEEDAADLLLAKLPAETRERFEQTQLEMYPDDSRLNVIAALLCAFTNHQEQHTGDFDSINRASLTLRAGQARDGNGAAPPRSSAPHGREPRPCECCGVTFMPAKLGQRFGCNPCGEYPTHLMIVDRDNALNGDNGVHRTYEPFDQFLRRRQMVCTCGQVTRQAEQQAARRLVPLAHRGYGMETGSSPGTGAGSFVPRDDGGLRAAEQARHQVAMAEYFAQQQRNAGRPEPVPPARDPAAGLPPEEAWGYNPQEAPVGDHEVIPALDEPQPRYPVPASLMRR